NPLQLDIDFDGLGDDCDAIINLPPAIPPPAAVSSLPIDDGAPELIDPGNSETAPSMNIAFDADNDGIDDEADNCQLIKNDDQIDSDEDGIGDACSKEEEAGGGCSILPSNAANDSSFFLFGAAMVFMFAMRKRAK